MPDRAARPILSLEELDRRSAEIRAGNSPRVEGAIGKNMPFSRLLLITLLGITSAALAEEAAPQTSEQNATCCPEGGAFGRPIFLETAV